MNRKMSVKFRRALENLRPYPPGKPIEEVQREYGIPCVIKLASNENLYGPSPRVLSALRQKLKQINYYPDANVYVLTQTLAKKLRVKPTNLIFGNGTDELILLIALTFLESSDNIVISKNAFIRYKMAAQVMGVPWKAVPMLNFCHNVEALLAAVDAQTRAIFLDNPNNPLGTCIGSKELEYLLQNLPQTVLLIVDEAYREFVSRRDYHHRSVEFLSKHPNLVLLRTFSKVYGLAGLRIGYAIANEEVISAINRVRPPFNVNSLAQAAALAALDDDAYIKQVAKNIVAQRKWLSKELRKLGLKFLPSETNFITIEMNSDSTMIAESLMKKGIIVRPLAGFGLKNYIRVTIGKPEHNQAFLKALKEILNQTKRGE